MPDPPATKSPGLPQLPVIDQPLDREDLLLAGLRAASVAAIGGADGKAQPSLDGKRFELRLRFGCPSDNVAPAATRNWTLDEGRGVVRLVIGPEIARDTPLVEQIIGSGFEAAEGFWIRRPWLLQAGCPVRRATQEVSLAPSEDKPIQGEPEADLPAEPAPWLGIAQFFTATDARTHRQNRRAYQTTERLSDGQAPSSEGYDLIVAGRLKSLPDGRVIACSTKGVRQPVCLLSAQFEQISLERGDNGKVLAEWPRG